MTKIILLFKMILRAKFVFKTPEKHDLIIFDEMSALDLNICLSRFNYFVLDTKIETTSKIYFSYKILKKMFKNYFRGNVFTVYLVSLIELTKAKVVITTMDNSFKFSEVAKILDKKTNFIAIQNATRLDFLEFNHFYNTKKTKHNLLKKFYIPNFFCFGEYERELYKKLDIKVNFFYPIGDLRLANCLHHIKTENESPKKYNSDICLVAEIGGRNMKFKKNDLRGPLLVDQNIEKGYAKLVKYTIKFCIKNNMKLIFASKRDKKYVPSAYEDEIEYFKKNLTKDEFDYLQKNLLEKDRDNYTTFRAVINSEVTVATGSTLLKDKLGIGGKILSCNLTQADMYNFPVNGICTLNNCSYEEFEKRLLEIYSISKANFFAKIDKKADYVMKFNKNKSSIDLIRDKLSQLGVNYLPENKEFKTDIKQILEKNKQLYFIKK